MMDLKKKRQAAGMTQKNLAEYLKVSIHTYQSWESGRRTPPEYAQGLLSDALDNLAPERHTCSTCKHFDPGKGSSGYCTAVDADVWAVRPQCVAEQRGEGSLYDPV